jgi:hypothetical protein
MHDGRLYFTLTTLRDGRVLAVGGYGGHDGCYTDLASAELYDPVTRMWSETGPLAAAHEYHKPSFCPTGASW